MVINSSCPQPSLAQVPDTGKDKQESYSGRDELLFCSPAPAPAQGWQKHVLSEGVADPSTWLGWTDRAPGGISTAPLLLSHCRHALPLFTSLLNTVCAYDPVGYGIPYNHLLFSDYREPLVEEAVQVLIVTLDHDSATSTSPTVDGTTTGTAMDDADVRTGGGEQGSCRPLGGWHSLQQSWARGIQWAPVVNLGPSEVKEALLPAPRPGVGAEGRGTCSPRSTLGSLQGPRTCS